MELHIITLGLLLLLQVGCVVLWDKPKRAHPGQFPHLISIEWSLPPNILHVHSCAGAIINELWGLTSAYCLAHIPLDTLQVKAGYHNISSLDEHVQTVAAAKTIIHKKYAGRNGLLGMASYDIGLVKFTKALVLNDHVRPIQLPRRKGWFTPFKMNYNMVISGWGSVGYGVLQQRDDILRTVTLPVVPSKVCVDSMRGLILGIQLHDYQMCTRPLDGSEAACIGDNGGPLIQYDEAKNPVVVGILTWSWNPCNTFGLPPIYTRVSPFVKWIDKKIKEN